jgi:hypothetical protein
VALRRRGWQVTRDKLLFWVGLGGFVFELASRQAERPTVLLILAGMMGLPAFIQRDEQERGGDEE